MGRFPQARRYEATDNRNVISGEVKLVHAILLSSGLQALFFVRFGGQILLAPCSCEGLWNLWFLHTVLNEKLMRLPFRKPTYPKRKWHLSAIHFQVFFAVSFRECNKKVSPKHRPSKHLGGVKRKVSDGQKFHDSWAAKFEQHVQGVPTLQKTKTPHPQRGTTLPNSWITRWLPKPQPKNPGSERSITFLKLREGDGPMVLLAGSPREGHIGFRHEKRRAPCRLVAYLGFLISEVHPGNHRSIQCASFISTFVGHKSLVGNVALLGSSRPRQFDLKYINHSRKTVEKWLRTWCD